MKNILNRLVDAISNIIVLFGGEAIEYDDTYLNDILNWFSNVGIDFID